MLNRQVLSWFRPVLGVVAFELAPLRPLLLPFGLLAGCWQAMALVCAQLSVPSRLPGTLTCVAAATILSWFSWQDMHASALAERAGPAPTAQVEFVRRVADSCGVRVDALFDARRANAGLFCASSLRGGWVACDMTMPAPVVRVTLAHEVGHAAFAHVPKLALALWSVGVAQTAALVLLPAPVNVVAAAVVAVAGLAVMSRLSRRFELAADRFARRWCGDTDFSAMVEFFAAVELPTRRLHRLFDTHPSWSARAAAPM